MRKILLLILMVSIVSMSVYSQSIKIVSPKGRSVWEHGNSMNIDWIKNGQMKNNIKIRLFFSSNKALALRITNSAKNNGHFKWKIPGSVSAGEYFIRVRTTDNKFTGDSGIFKIKAKANNVEPKKENKIDPNLPRFDPNAGNNLYPKYRIKENTLARTKVVYFKPERRKINLGESVKLIFQYTGAMNAEVFNKTENKKQNLSNPKFPDYKGYIIVKPEKTSLYELVASGAVNRDSRTCMVDVNFTPMNKKYNLPKVINRFEAVPTIVDYGKKTTLRFRITNATGIVVKDSMGKIVLDWSGGVNDIVTKSIPVGVHSGKNEYKLTATNNSGAHYALAWARYRPVVNNFSAIRRGQKVVFKYKFSVVNTAYIKYKPARVGGKFERIYKITANYSLNTPKVHSGEHTSNYKTGTYILVLIGDREVVSSKPVYIK